MPPKKTNKNNNILETLAKECAKNIHSSKTGFLDGRYFNLLLRGFKEWNPTPVTLQFIHGLPDGNMQLTVSGGSIMHEGKDNKGSVMLTRLIIEMYKKHGKTNQLMSRHSNLCIVDHINKTITRFEPQGYQYADSDLVDRTLMYTDYLYLKNSNFPEASKSKPMHHHGWCAAEVMKEACFRLTKDITFRLTDAAKLTYLIENQFSASDLKKEGSKPDIEGMHKRTRNDLIGSVVGGGLGYAAFGPVGLLLGAGGGYLLTDTLQDKK